MGVRLMAVVSVAGVGLLLTATMGGCALWGPEGGPGGAGMAAAPTSTATESAVDAVPGADGVQRVEVSASDSLRLTPAWVRARPGVIEFVFHNGGGTPHAVVVLLGGPGPTPGTGNLNGGQSQVVRVSVARPGRYPFPCAYHLSSGMSGTLEVVAA